MLLRLESDTGPVKTTGPFIFAKEFNKYAFSSLFLFKPKFMYCRTFIFSLHVEKDELLDTLEFAEAVTAFLHLCFVCDLKYPKVNV